MKVIKQIPQVLKYSYYHEALIFFLLSYSRGNLVEQLEQWVRTGQVIDQLSKGEDELFVEIAYEQAELRLSLYVTILHDIQTTYGVSERHIYSTMLSIVSKMEEMGKIAVNKILSLFVIDHQDLAHLKLARYDLYQFRREIYDTWIDSGV